MAEKMNIVWMNIDNVFPYEKNPRINDDAVEFVKNSIKEFGWKQPIVVDDKNIIIAGHTRLKAAKELGIKEVPVLIASDLTDEQVRAYRLADNKTAEMAEWDMGLLNEELGALSDFDMSDFGFDFLEEEEKKEESIYTEKADVPQYEIKGDNPSLDQLCDTGKYKALIEEIEMNRDEIGDEVAEFLEFAAARHIRFNYGAIAEYYAHASEEVQELMERSALVIIDMENAMRNGYVEMRTALEGMIEDGE